MCAPSDTIGIERFKLMERKLYYGIMMPGAIFSLVFGVWLISYNFSSYMHAAWMHGKLGFVVLLILYHIYLGHLLKQFKYDRNTHGHVFYRMLNEVPVLFLVCIVCLVVLKP